MAKIIYKYKGDGTDCVLFNQKLGNHTSGEIFENTDRYEIYSPELKKEARKMVIPTGDIEDSGVCRVGTQIGENSKKRI